MTIIEPARVFRREPDGTVRELGDNEPVDLAFPHYWTPEVTDEPIGPQTIPDGWTEVGYTTDEPWPPIAGATKRAGELVDRIDGTLAEWAVQKPDALALVADNDWCVKALAHRNITIPGANA